MVYFFFFFNDTATTEIYTLSLHDALPICGRAHRHGARVPARIQGGESPDSGARLERRGAARVCPVPASGGATRAPGPAGGDSAGISGAVRREAEPRARRRHPRE